MKILNIADSREWLVVDHEDGTDPEDMLVKEFIDTYGYSPLAETEQRLEEAMEAYKETLDPVEVYWDTLVDICDTVDDILAWTAPADNADNGGYAAQEVVHNYFEHDLTHVDEAVAHAQAHAKKALRDLEEIGRNKFGFKPMSENGKNSFKQFIANNKRRTYVLNWAKKYRAQGEVLSIGELMRQSYRKQKSLWPEEWREKGCPY